MALNAPVIINPTNRIQLFRGLVLLLLSGLCVRLWFLQVIYGSYYRDKSENNRIRTVRLVAARGRIFDRNDNILVSNRPSFNIGIMLEDVKDPALSIAEVARLGGLDPGLLFDNFRQNRTARRFEPRILAEDVSIQQFASLKANSYQLQGITFDSQPTRNYPYKTTAAQIFGYVREITKLQLTELEGLNYRIGDTTGQTGLEKAYEDVLRGYSGYLQLEVDAKGVRKQELGKILASSGRDLKLSIDIDLQQSAESSLGEYRGAVIALDPNNGDILALASTPTFDANIFSGELLLKEWEEISKNPARPMVNRAISNTYPLGSTSKLLWSIAGLNENIINQNSNIHCPGYFKLGNRRYLCNKTSGHGSLDLKMALTVSCNAYFYNLGQSLGIERLSKYLSNFGFGEKTGIDLLGEEEGTAPNPAWKKRVFKQKWYPGDTVPISIGQGYFISTPIQLAQLGMSIANGGKLFRPRIVKAVANKDEPSKLIPIDPIFKKDLVRDGLVRSDVIKLVRELSASVVEHERGTAKAARLPGVRVGGKTGTAQVVRKGLDVNSKINKDHAWFIGYAPIESPTIVVVAVVENSGHGGEFAAPVVRNVMYKFFDKQGLINHELEKSILKSGGNKIKITNSHESASVVETSDYLDQNDSSEESEDDAVEEEIESPSEEQILKDEIGKNKDQIKNHNENESGWFQ